MKSETVKQIRTILEAVERLAGEAETRGGFTPEERAHVTAEMERAKALKEHDAKQAEDDAMLDTVRALIGPDVDVKASEVNELVLAGATTGALSKAARGASPADLFLAGEGLKAFRERFPNGEVPAKTRIDIAGVHVGGIKALITGASDTLGGALVRSDWLGLQDVGPFLRPPTIRDVITVGQTSSDQIDYARITSVTNNAAPVPEATSSATPGLAGVAVGAYTAAHGVKPESAMAFEVVTTTVKTIATWIPATTRALNDAGQLRTIIETFLRQALEEELEDQIVNGDGTGNNFTGIFATSGTQVQGFTTDLFTTARKALTKVADAYATATAWLIHPTEVEAIDLARDGQQRFFGNGPFGIGPRTLWGVPVVETKAVPTGFALVGDFRTVVLWDRERATISASNSHNDFFVRNLVAILAELRAALGLIKPSAIVEVDLVTP